MLRQATRREVHEQHEAGDDADQPGCSSSRNARSPGGVKTTTRDDFTGRAQPRAKTRSSTAVPSAPPR